ncbi:Trypsin 5G1 [Eufriesea mexicana]|uniref:Trypsin 5G1 n=1 Tax=Eufriesea mexicana TaxID=516756 RepID=A0A310SN03_9HYME|nr:Trypsin 5G1 [Eufriesea mexicana]
MHALLFLVIVSSSVLGEPSGLFCGPVACVPSDYGGRIVSESARFPRLAESRIIGGEWAAIEEYPFAVSITCDRSSRSIWHLEDRCFSSQVSLQNNGTFFGHQVEHFCGGSIVGEKWIITSAQIQVKPFHVRAGTSYYYQGGDVYGVQSVAIHPAFNTFNYDYDVGLVELSSSITFDRTKQPIQLPKTYSIITDGSLVEVLGWGASRLLGPVSDALLQNKMRKISNENCEEASGDLVTNRMFCTLSDTARPCVGDSGSPLVFGNTLFGVASWSRSCEWQYPTAFTAIAEVKDWISDVTDSWHRVNPCVLDTDIPWRACYPPALVFSLPWHAGIMLSRVISASLGGSEAVCSFNETAEEALSVTPECPWASLPWTLAQRTERPVNPIAPSKNGAVTAAFEFANSYSGPPPGGVNGKRQKWTISSVQINSNRSPIPDVSRTDSGEFNMRPITA